MLHINDLTYRIGGRMLFDGATCNVPKGHRVGLVGRNGTGKTTLFKLILGDLSADGGSLNVRPGASVGTVAQEAPSGPDSLIDVVLAADTERTGLLAQAETETDPHEIAHIHTRLADIKAETAPARAARILAGLGFDEAAQQRPCAEYSGGWRMRVALAAALFANPDLLLLDEPTNHLDLEAALWLEGYLASWPGTLIVISHDRTLLNTVVGEIVHLHGRKLTRYAGGYDRFERTRRERQELDSKMRTKQQAQRRHIEAFVERFRYKASKARQAQSRLKMLERMQPIASVVEDRTVAFNFPDPDPLSPPLIALDRASVGYGGDLVLRNLDLRIDMDDRIALIGANGNGKSTLVKLLAGRLKTMDGKLVKSSKLKVGYFAQHQAEELTLAETPYQHLARLMPMATEAKVRAHLGRFGFSGERADVKCEGLSGGEKARMLFAMMSLEAPQLMLLDEPTNHLDVDAREALVQALNAYDGAVILVSHDAHLVELVADRLWLVADGGCRPFEGDLGDYGRDLQEARRAQRRETREQAPDAAPSRKEARRERAAQRAETADLRKTLKRHEAAMEKLSAERETLEARLADPEVYEGPTSALMELQVRHAEIKSELAASEEAWLELSQQLEAAE
ncbi:MAG: ABC-F family ATP-binding cassette domain-containing protein [Magnetovibrio sp.]|nr:ABC-F family ATP-binding cassette domain-containing protein [Magnetovibrio sp.]